jgi:hypothetical protein
MCAQTELHRISRARHIVTSLKLEKLVGRIPFYFCAKQQQQQQQQLLDPCDSKHNNQPDVHNDNDNNNTRNCDWGQTGVQINENACDGFIRDTSALDHSSQGSEMQSATSSSSRCTYDELQNANKLKSIQLFYCYAIVSNAGLNCRSNAIVIILVIVRDFFVIFLGFLAEGILDEWVRPYQGKT